VRNEMVIHTEESGWNMSQRLLSDNNSKEIYNSHQSEATIFMPILLNQQAKIILL
jgi:hypothetical protein